MEERAESAHERARRHSADELSCLAVQFPPFFVSTRGLSRPATPIERHVTRYFQIVQHSIDEKLIWPLTEHTVCYWLCASSHSFPLPASSEYEYMLC